MAFWYADRDLIRATERGDAEAVEKLLNPSIFGRMPCLIDLYQGKTTALHLACSAGYNQIVNLLIQHGAAPNIPDQYQLQPMVYALSNPNPQTRQVIVAALLEKHRYYNYYPFPTITLSTRLTIRDDGSADTTKIVPSIVCNAFLMAVSWYDDPTLLELMYQSIRNSVPNRPKERLTHEKQGALHLAAKYGRINNFKYMVSQGWSLNDRDQHGYTPLHLAARHGHASIVELLLMPKLHQVDNHHNTFLHHAASHHHSNVIKTAIDGLDPTAIQTLTAAKNKYGMDVIDVAYQHFIKMIEQKNEAAIFDAHECLILLYKQNLKLAQIDFEFQTFSEYENLLAWHQIQYGYYQTYRTLQSATDTIAKGYKTLSDSHSLPLAYQHLPEQTFYYQRPGIDFQFHLTTTGKHFQHQTHDTADKPYQLTSKVH